jgi:hypothetical protein
MCAGTYLNWDNSPDLWLEYVATATGTIYFSTCDSATYDTSLALYEGDCDTQVACNGDDASCGGFTSIMTYSCTQGETYFVRIGGYMGAFGSGTLNIIP